MGFLEQRHANDERLTGAYKASVLDGADRAEHQPLGTGAVADELSRGVSHGLDHEDTREDREVCEVVLQVLLGGGDALDGDDVLFAAFEDAVHQAQVHEERYAPVVSRTSDQAVCLRHWDWSETSQTLALFTRAHGVLRAIAKGSRRPNTPYSGGVELLTRGEATLLMKATTDLHLLVEWDLSETFPALRADLRVYYTGAYAAECVQRMVHDHDPHPELFDALVVLLRSLDGPSSVPLALLRFQHQLLLWCGFKPEIDEVAPSLGGSAVAGVRHFSPDHGALVTQTVSTGAVVWPIRASTLGVLRAVSSPDGLRVLPAGATGRDVERANHFLASYICHLLGSPPNSLRTVFPMLVVPEARSSPRR